MKIHLDLPGGGRFEIERKPREPMPQGRFEALCWLIGICTGAAFLLKLSLAFLSIP